MSFACVVFCACFLFVALFALQFGVWCVLPFICACPRPSVHLQCASSSAPPSVNVPCLSPPGMHTYMCTCEVFSLHSHSRFLPRFCTMYDTHVLIRSVLTLYHDGKSTLAPAGGFCQVEVHTISTYVHTIYRVLTHSLSLILSISSQCQYAHTRPFLYALGAF